MVKERFKVFAGGYKFDKRVFRVTFLVVVLFALWVGVFFSGSYYYVECPEDSINFYCANPLYGGCDGYVCEDVSIPRGGSLGVKPPFVVKYSLFVVFVVLGLGFCFNHFKYNGRKK